MKTRGLLVSLIFILFMLPGLGQVNSNIDNANPKKELQKARQNLQKALKENDSPMIIKSLILEMKYQSLIDRDSIFPLIRDLEKFTVACSRPVEKSILHSILAEVYQMVYKANAYEINSRTPVTDFIPDDMKVWTGNIYLEKIFQHLRASLQPAQALKNTTTQSYKEILIPGKDSAHIQLSMFGLLTNQAIDILDGCRPYVSLFFPQTPLTDSVLMAPVNEFVKIQIKQDSCDINRIILSLYQNLLQAQVQARRDAALVFDDLRRLDFLRIHLALWNRDMLYEKALNELNHTYRDTPYQMEVLIALARFYNDRNYKDKSILLQYRQKALEFCNEGIRRFPNDMRIGILKNIREELLCPNARFIGVDNVYPGQEQKLQVNYRNLSSIEITLYQIKGSPVNYVRKRASRVKISSKEYFLQSSMVEQDTLLHYPIPQLGLYEMIIRSPENKGLIDTLTFSSSRLVGISRQIGEKSYNILVCDFISGKPVEGARVNLYSSNLQKYKYIAQVTTDKNGIAHIRNLNRYNRFFQIIYGSDSCGRPNPVNGYYFADRGKTVNHVNLFTDRKIYRPGQTVYFNGIAWRADSMNANAVIGENYQVSLRDVNGREVAKEIFTTNEFGSFSGKFVLPKNTLNGHFSLEVSPGDVFTVLVEEYKRPKFDITFRPINYAYQLGDDITVYGDAKTYSGVNMEDCVISYTIERQNMRMWSNIHMRVAQGCTRTNKSGEFHITFPTQGDTLIDSPSEYCRYDIHVTLTSPNGETQEADYPVRVTRQAYRLTTDMYSRIDKNIPQKIRASAYNTNGILLKQSIRYKVERLKPLQKIGETYETHPISVQQEMLQGTCTTDTSSLDFDFSTYPSGAYLLTLQGSTPRDSNVRYQHLFYLYSPTDKRPPYSTYNWVVEEKTTCAPGENAKIILGTSAQNVYVLCEVYADRQFVERKRFILSDENKTLLFPYENNYGSSAEVIISYFKDQQFFNNKIVLKREEENKQLDIFTRTFRDHLFPGQQEEWSFTVKNKAGQGILSELMAGMYDASLDQFAKNTWYFDPRIIYPLEAPRWSSFYLRNIYGFFFVPLSSFDSPLYSVARLNDFSLREAWYRSELFFYRGISRAAGVTELKANKKAYKDERIEEGEVSGIVAFAAQRTSDVEMPEPEMTTGPGNSRNIRKDFQETAFFYPQLRTNASGEVSFNFTVPDANTTWNFRALAHTPDMYFGSLEKSVITSKPFMVSTNLPRFIRVGDHVVLQATLQNLSSDSQQGEVYLELFIPSTEEIINKQTTSFHILARENETVSFSFTVPQNMDLLGCRMVATSQRYSDGEQHVLPVIPDATLVTQTLPIFASRQGAETFSISVPKGITPYRLTLELTANPVWYAVLALPSISTPRSESITDQLAAYYVSSLASTIATANPQIARTIQSWLTTDASALTSPLMQNEELKSILLQLTPWVAETYNQTEQMHALGELFDKNRQGYIQKQTLDKLLRLQNEDGSWSWFPGFSSNRFITENVLEVFSRLTAIGSLEANAQVKKAQIQALQYLDKTIRQDFEKKIQGGYSQILYLYTRSAYRDIPLGNTLEAHKFYLSYFKQHWATLTLYEKALMAITLFRYGRQEMAREILHSLREYSTKTPETGMFWANNRSRYYTNSAIQTQVAILNAFYEVEGASKEIDLMKQWLLRQKQTQDWGSTPATVDAIFALLLTGSDRLSAPENLTVKVDRKTLDIPLEDKALGYIKQSFSGKEIPSPTTRVTITKQTDQLTWGGLYLQYFEKFDRVMAHSGGISVEKQLFLEVNGDSGNKLLPLNANGEQRELKVGDKVNIRISVTTDQDMQFVHIKDFRAGCFEPINQLSENKWQAGILYYQETDDIATNFFFDYLPKGTHVFEYTVWVAQNGTYMDGITTVQCIYAPQFSANSKSQVVKVE